MAASLDELVIRWRTSRDAASTVALCDALYRSPSPALASEVGEVALEAFATNATVLVAVARMYTAAERYPEAQNLLVSAGKVAPRDASVYRWLGEVLLRKGDAERAEKVLERAIQLGTTDPGARVWLDRAQVFKPMMARGGARAVAAEIARTSSPSGGSPRAPMESVSDAPTEVLPSDIRASLRKEPSSGSQTAVLPAELRTQLRQASSPPPQRVAAPPLGGGSPAPGPLPRSPSSPAAPPPSIPPLSPPPMRARPLSLGNAPPLRESPAPPPPPRPPPTTMSTGADVFEVRHVAVQATDPDGPTMTGRLPAPVLTPPQATKPVLPHPRDVLDALALAGVFEPEAAAAKPAAGWDVAGATPKRRGTFTLVALLLLSIAGGFGGFAYVKHRREVHHRQAEVLLQKVESDLRASLPSSLEPMEQTLAQVFELDSRSPRAALDWLRERGMRGLLQGGESIAFEEGIARAKEVGVKEQEVAFARLASFLYQHDTAGAASLLPKWDGPAADDAWYQLLAGATLERAGDGRAVERYIAAQKLDSQLLVAQFALVRVIALEGDPARGMELARELRTRFPERAEGAALVALAWGRHLVRPEPAPPELEEAQRRAGELPLGLAAVPHAVVALRAVAKHTAAGAAAPDATNHEAARAAIQSGLVASDGPGMAAWFGNLALELGDEALARKAALTAVQFSASYGPARVLAARVALLGDRLDEAVKATEDLDATSPDVAVVRAATAYERADADALGRALEVLSPEARRLPFLAAVSLSPDVLSGHAQASMEKAFELATGDAPWGDLVGMDLALDTGDVATAEKIAAAWGESAGRPSRAVRLSRLARTLDKLDVADAMSQAALTKGAVTMRVIAERVFVLVARGKVADVGPLLARYPAVLGPLATWLSAYAAASTGKTDEARGRTASLDPPPALAPLPARLIAAASLGTMHDRKRGPDYVKELLTAGVESVEVTQAAIALGFRKIERRGKRPIYEKP